MALVWPYGWGHHLIFYFIPMLISKTHLSFLNNIFDAAQGVHLTPELHITYELIYPMPKQKFCLYLNTCNVWFHSTGLEFYKRGRGTCTWGDPRMEG